MIACCVGGKGAGVRMWKVTGYQVFILKLSDLFVNVVDLQPHSISLHVHKLFKNFHSIWTLVITLQFHDIKPLCTRAVILRHQLAPGLGFIVYIRLPYYLFVRLDGTIPSLVVGRLNLCAWEVIPLFVYLLLKFNSIPIQRQAIITHNVICNRKSSRGNTNLRKSKGIFI